MKAANLLLSLVLHFAIQTHAQEYIPVRYGTEKGLPGSQVYDLVSDAQGFLWVATDMGLARFNGVSFQNFTQLQGLPEPVMVRLCTSHDGGLWLLGASRRLYRLSNGIFERDAYDSTLQKLLGEAAVTSLSADENGNVFLGVLAPCGQSPFYMRFNGTVWQVVTPKAEAYVLTQGKRVIFGGSRCQPVRRIQVDDSIATLESEVETRDIKASVNDKGQPVWSAGRTVYRFTRPFLRTPAPVYRLFGADDGVLAGLHFAGGWLYTKQRPGRFLAVDQTVTAFCRDSEGGYWLGTLSDGLYYIRDIEIYQLQKTQGRDIRALAGHGNDWLAADAAGEVFAFSMMPDKSFSPPESQGFGQVQNIVWRNKFVRLYEHEPGSDGLPEPAIDILSVGDTLWLGQLTSLTAFVRKSKVFDGRAHGLNSRVNRLLSHNNRLWAGSIRGLWFISNNKAERLETNTWPIDAHVSSLASTGNALAVGTYGLGLWVFGENDTTIIDSRSGLLSDMVSDLQTDPDGTLWIATNKGLVCRRPDGNLLYLHSGLGLPYEEISRIALHPEFVLLSSRKGITIVERNFFSRATAPPTVRIARMSQELAEEVPFGATGLQIWVEAISFRNLGNTLFRYRFNSRIGWTETSNPEITVPAQRPGKIVVELQAKLNGGTWGPVNRQVQYIVLRPWWQWWWVWLLLVAALGTIMSLIIYLNRRRIVQKNATKMEIQTLKLQALSAQMNPHFIFNSLNSIQRFLLDNDVRNSNKYLAKFANLMRLILNNSSHTFVVLEEVVQVLRLYIELEQLRFGNKFSFSIEIDPKIDLRTTKVPPMLIQPFAENAILHGILPLENKEGMVCISIMPGSKSTLRCTITDNGVGRAFHANKPEKAHKSKGLQITKERLRSYGMFKSTSYQLQFEDIKNADNQVAGTRVLLDLPYTSNKDF